MLFSNNRVFHISSTAVQAYEITAPMARTTSAKKKSEKIALCYTVGRTALLI
jgi:hypothetical protein